MAEELAYDVTARDRGAGRVLGSVGSAMRKLEEHTGKLDAASGKLADAQLKVRSAMVGVTRAEDGLTAARKKLAVVTADATASDDDKRRAANAVEAAEVRHARALRTVQTAGESAAKTARAVAAAQRENEAATERSTRAQRIFGRTAQTSSRVAAKGYVGVSKSIGGVRVGVGAVTSTMLAGIPVVGGLVVGLGMLTKGVFGAAANLQTLHRRAELVYGKALPEMERWGRKVGARAGMTAAEVLGMTAAFDTNFRSLGLSQKQARSYSQEMLVVSAAVAEASAGQIDAAGAAEVVASAFRGEYDSAQTLGIAISDQAVKAEALRQTHKKSEADLTDLEKAQAAYTLIMKGTAQQQELYAKGSGTLAAKQAALSAKFGEVKNAVLTGLTPSLTSLGDWLVKNSDKFVGWAFAGAAAAITFGESVLLGVADIMSGLGDVQIAIGTFVRDTIGGFAQTGTAAALMAAALGVSLSSKAKGALSDLQKAAQTAGQGMVDAGTRTKAGADVIRKNVPPAADAARRTLENMRRAALGLPPLVATKVTTPGAPASKAHLDAVKKAADSIPRVRSVTVQVNQVGSIQRIQREINSVTGKVVSIQVNRVGGAGGITGNATGTPFWPGGVTMVGERGRELVDLPRGSRIYDDARTRTMLARGESTAPARSAPRAGGGPRDLGVLTLAYPNGETLAQLLLTEERRGGRIKVSRR